MYNLIPNNHIDKKKWDEAIRQSNMPLVNAESWFLDVLSPGWEALVNKEYSVLTPIPVKRKYMLKAALQPILCQQLGVFYSKEEFVDYENISRILKKRYQYINLCVHDQCKRMIHGAKLRIRNNYVVNLNKAADIIGSYYSKSHQKNLRRAEKQQLHVDTISIERAMNFLHDEYIGKIKQFDVHTFQSYTQLLYQAQEKAQALCLGAHSEDNLYAVAAIVHNKKHINSFYIASDEGKQRKALFFLIDNILKRFANSSMVFDFGGSDIDTIAYFNEGFGAIQQNYYQMKWSKIPFI